MTLIVQIKIIKQLTGTFKKIYYSQLAIFFIFINYLYFFLSLAYVSKSVSTILDLLLKPTIPSNIIKKKIDSAFKIFPLKI